MTNVLSKLSWTSRLAIVTLILGLGALVLGTPYSGERVSMNVNELSHLIQSEDDHVEVQELADWIIKGNADFRLIDVRSDADFLEYHIPGAENYGLSDLSSADLQRNEKLVLYSEGGIHAAQAWMLLVARGYRKSYILLGGLEEWKNSILFPRFPENLSPALDDSIAKVQAVSEFFGGRIQTVGVLDEAPAASSPELQLPHTTSSPPKGQASKKKKEGC